MYFIDFQVFTRMQLQVPSLQGDTLMKRKSNTAPSTSGELHVHDLSSTTHGVRMYGSRIALYGGRIALSPCERDTLIPSTFPTVLNTAAPYEMPE